MISVTSVADTAFCERQAYLAHVLRLPPPDPAPFAKGSARHAVLEAIITKPKGEWESIAREIVRRKAGELAAAGVRPEEVLEAALAELAVREPPKHECITERFLTSAELGIRGYADRIELRGAEWVPFEYKTGNMARFQRDAVQLSCYGLLIKSAGQACTHGFIEYGTKEVRVDFTDEAAAGVLRWRDRFLDIASGLEPCATGECEHCIYRATCAQGY